MSDERLGAHVASRRGTLLCVDPDELLLEMITTALCLSRPKWCVIAAHSPAQALHVLEQHSQIDAVVTEVAFGQSAVAGQELIRELSRRWPEIPILVMTRLDRDAIHALESAEYIAKPPDVDFLVSRIDRILRRQRESQVRGIALTTFLQILEIDQKTCTVHVSHAGRVGAIYFRDGRLIQARHGARNGKEALFDLLSMPEHSLRVVDTCDAETAIFTPLASLLMEWSVREDHTTRNAFASSEEEK